MNLKTIHIDKKTALEKWRDYKRAYNIHRKPIDLDMRKIYNQAKLGRQIVDIVEVIKAAGTRRIEESGVLKSFHPNFAIARADTQKVFCRYYSNGKITFQSERLWQKDTKAILLPIDTLPRLSGISEISIEAAVPKIPTTVWRGKISKDHYILWHVDKWDMSPSADPVLLKRITKTLFVVLAVWDLDPLELAVMKDYI